MKIPKIKWTREPGDGTGSSPKDMEVRNERGICGFQKCGNKLGDNPGSYELGVSMKLKCLACGIEKDPEVKETYPYPEEDLFIDEPMDPFFSLDCQACHDVSEEHRQWRKVRVCHVCFHKSDPDMWISSRCRKSLNPATPFEELPLLES